VTARPSNFSRRVRLALLPVLLFSKKMLWAQAAAPQTNDIPALRPPRAEIPPNWWELHGAAVVIGVSLALLFLALVIWLIRHITPRAGQPPEVVATNALTRLKNEPESGAILSMVSRTLRQYLGAVFGLPPVELTTREFCGALHENSSAGRELAEDVSRFLQECDQRKFAPNNQAAQMGAATRALGLVEAAEKRRVALRQSQAEASTGNKAQ
jgi:hypothetical protein